MTAALVWGDDQFWGFTAAAVCEGFLLHRAAKPKALCPVATPGCAGLTPGLSVGALPSWIDPGGSVVFGQRLLAQDVIGAFFAHHNRWPVQVSLGDAWEDRAVDHAQRVHPNHP